MVKRFSDLLITGAGRLQATSGKTFWPWSGSKTATAEHASSGESQSAIWSRLFAPVDIASLVYFRVAFGAIMLWEVVRYFEFGWISGDWIEPTYHFPFFGFEWVRPWPGYGMYWHFLALGILAAFIIVGFQYRISATLFFLGFTYVFLSEKALYLNHFYLISLISLLTIFIPAHRAVSFDASRRPAIHSHTAPVWALWLLRAQVGIAYFYGGLAKLNGDWFRGEPMRIWLAQRTDFPLIGSLFTEEWVVYLFSYSGLLLDLLVVPLLLWRRTRPYAYAGAVVFHVMNARLWSIGIFPWFMIAATALFFSPDWPRTLGRWPLAPSTDQEEPTPSSRLSLGQRITLVLLGSYLAVQLLVPLRHFLYPGNVSWTEEGHNFAWHMKLRDKNASAKFFVTDTESQTTWEIDPRDYLTSWQSRKMSIRPHMILQFAHYLEDELHDEGYEQIEIRAEVMASLNGRERQLLVDPTVDLTAQKWTLKPATWIVPLETPLTTGWGRS